MASISAFGIIGAAPIAALAASSLAVAQPAATGASFDLKVRIDGLRDSKGVVRLCLTSRADAFPQCKAGTAVAATVKAAKGAVDYRFQGVRPGTYAVAAFHDANGNGKLDKVMGVPKEGFAFSRNPPVRPRAPTFTEAHFTVVGESAETLRMRYIL